MMMENAPAFGLIGYPVSHSLSPALFKAAYGGKYDYALIGGETFGKAWEAFASGPWKAVNVTAPYKTAAANAALVRSREVQEIGAANILVRTEDGIAAYNSDYLGVRLLLGEVAPEGGTAAVIGLGGAGRAALAAARDCGFQVRAFHHDGIADGVSADVVICTLPRPVEGLDRLDCRVLVEANYLEPCLEGHPGYVGGKRWLLAQAICGFGLMTGEEPDVEAMKKIF